MRSAPRFQLVTMPSGVLAVMASSDESTMNARSAVLACSDCIVVSFVPFAHFSDFLRPSRLPDCIISRKTDRQPLRKYAQPTREIADFTVSAGDFDVLGSRF